LIIPYDLSVGEYARVGISTGFSLSVPNLLISRGRDLNILAASSTTVVSWAAREPALEEYSFTRFFELSTVITLPLLFQTYRFCITEVRSIFRFA
jgi:hypothetical protein